MLVIINDDDDENLLILYSSQTVRNTSVVDKFGVLCVSVRETYPPWGTVVGGFSKSIFERTNYGSG